jgi:hypothetical protein
MFLWRDSGFLRLSLEFLGQGREDALNRDGHLTTETDVPRTGWLTVFGREGSVPRGSEFRLLTREREIDPVPDTDGSFSTRLFIRKGERITIQVLP